MVLATNSEACSRFGVSNNSTIRLYPACCLVLSKLISLNEREKNATSAPEITKEINNKRTSRKIKSVSVWVLSTAGSDEQRKHRVMVQNEGILLRIDGKTTFVKFEDILKYVFKTVSLRLFLQQGARQHYQCPPYYRGLIA